MSKPDWEVIGAAYCAGVMALREITSQHDISEGTMQNHTNYWVSETDNIIGKDDGNSPRLTDAAKRDYFTLRERIVTVTKQVGYLQDYINAQCLK